MSYRLFQLFLSKCRTPSCSLSFWMERIFCTVSSAIRYCWFRVMCNNAHVCDLHHFSYMPQLSLPEYTGSSIILGIQSPLRTWVTGFTSCVCLSMYLHQYTNWHNSGLNWIKGLKLNLFNIAYFDSNLLQNNSQWRVFQNCYS